MLSKGGGRDCQQNGSLFQRIARFLFTKVTYKSVDESVYQLMPVGERPLGIATIERPVNVGSSFANLIRRCEDEVFRERFLGPSANQ
jgi:hypothetical protein